MRRPLLLLAAVALGSPVAGAARVPLPADLSGTLGGTPYRIRVPANWNGTLLVYAHGTASGGVETAGGGDSLVQVFVETGHVSFSAEQYLVAVGALEH